MVNKLPVNKGISSSAVTNVPTEWSPAWFKSFITNFLANTDTRNATGEPNVQISGTLDTPATLQTSNPTIIAVRTAASSSVSNVLAPDTSLVLTFTKTGFYTLEIFLPVYEKTSGVGGFQFDLGNTSATITNLSYGVVGFTGALTTTTQATQVLTISTSSSRPSWIWAKGFLCVTGTGALGLRWGQSSTQAAAATVLQTGAYMIATKIG